jgi:hypothetical protein
MEIFESVIKALLSSAATGEIALFLAGILFCLWGLAFYLRFFERYDELLDTLREVRRILRIIESNQKTRKIKDRLAKGEEITDEL